MMWVRWTLPRLRIDQVMMICLKYLLPISCVLLLGVSLWRVLMVDPVQDYFRFGMLAVCAGLCGDAGEAVVTRGPARRLVRRMPGMWRMTHVTGYQGSKQQ